MLFGLNKRSTPKEEVVLPDLGPFSAGGEEPTLKEMLSDPMIHQVARSDKISHQELQDNVEEMRKRLRQKTGH